MRFLKERILLVRVSTSIFKLLFVAILGITAQCFGQSLGNAGTVQGTVLDATGAVVPGAIISATNPVTGYKQEAHSGTDGAFQLSNLPPNTYHLEVNAAGFAAFQRDIFVRNSLPVQVTAKLEVAGTTTSVNVEAAGSDVLEINPTAHVDTDRNQLLKLPALDPAAGLSQAVTLNSGGVAADANGFFHPLGDHAQVTFVIDGQPISDQQSKAFSTQLPTNAIQSMELDTGSANAEFGDKTSLVAQVTTRSGLGSKGFFGNVDTTYGSFGSVTGSIGLGWGNAHEGNFLAVDSGRSGRFLDTPEFRPLHDKGNNLSVFDRYDLQATPNDIFHLNLFAARNWFQIPNDLDQLQQDQRQKVVTWSVAPGYQHTFGSQVLLTINPYVRKDQLEYFGSPNPFDDTPATQGQNRHLMQWGFKSDVSITKGRHNVKVGLDLKQTRLYEAFNFGITDPGFNDPTAPNFLPGLAPFDLTRGGSLFRFNARHNVNQYAAYVQDSISLGNFVFNVGLRGDLYYGLVSAGAPEPRAGVAYNVKRTGTVLRAAYSRTFETPFNENLLLSSATGTGGLAENVFGASNVALIRPGRRNQYNAGIQQALGRWLLLDADYFWKYTTNAYDFSTLLNTTITFPIAWNKSKLDGVTGRLSTTNIHGFQAYWTFGHTRARFFPPETGGLISIQPTSVFRIDHDQAFQSTANLRYQRPKSAEYIDFMWRFDSGEVVSGVPDAGAALALTPNQQVTLGLACGGVYATLTNPLSPSNCSGAVTSKLINLPQGGYNGIPSRENDDKNPARVKPRNLFNIGIGSDNLLHAEGKKRIVASLQVLNLTNKVALYNFLSTFSGTHFLEPRSFVAHMGYTF